jgi:glycosyltransferase involved in cell wall biosynthesis
MTAVETFAPARHFTTIGPETRSLAAQSSGPVLVVGPGGHFLSGVSYYTAALTEALAETDDVALLTMRKLCPRRLYPGRDRVGQTIATLETPDGVETYDGMDYYWGRSAVESVRFIRRVRPRVVVLQWWTATTAHSYLLLAKAAQRVGAKVVIEFHEIQDVGEAKLPGAGSYARRMMESLLRRAHAVVVHSSHDARAVRRAYKMHIALPVEVIQVGPFAVPGLKKLRPVRAPGGPLRLLFFGVLRPYKGLEDLAEAFRSLVDSGEDVHLSIVGEVWQDYRGPLDTLAATVASDRFKVVEGYVPDEELGRHFAEADLLVLPYRRSSASGPLHMAMAGGLPVVTTAVGGLIEAAQDYTGAVLVEPGDPVALAVGIKRASRLIGRHHPDPHSWARNAERFQDLFARIGAPSAKSTTEAVSMPLRKTA